MTGNGCNWVSGRTISPLCGPLAQVVSASDLSVFAPRVLHPRPGHLVEDLTRSQNLVESCSGPLPHDIVLHEQTEWAWIPLPEPILHPYALVDWASALSVRPEALRALLQGELAVDIDDALIVWPWYPEQDDGLHRRALAFANHLGVNMPRRFLDAPYESAFYLQRTGEPALMRWVQARGIDPSPCLVRLLPVPPAAERPSHVGPGGCQTPHPLTVTAGRWVNNPACGLPREAMLDLFGLREPRRNLGHTPSATMRPAQAPPEQPTVVTLVGLSEGALLKLPDALHHVDGERLVQRFEGVYGTIECTIEPLVFLLFEGERYVFDLERGTLRSEPIEHLLAEVLALDAVVPDEQHGPGLLDPTGRFLWNEGGLFRTATSACVALADDVPWRSPVPNPPAPLLGLPAHPTHQVRVEHGASAFVLASQGWRAVENGLLLEGPCPRNTVDGVVQAAFAPHGQTLWLIATGALHQIQWRDRPKLTSSVSLRTLVTPS